MNVPTKEKLLLDKINDVLFRVHNAHLVRRELHLHANKTVSPVSSELYLSQTNKYLNFFLPVLDSTQAYVFNHLNSLVSTNEDRSLNRIIVRMAANGKKDFSSELSTLRDRHSTALKVITTYRMNTFAHLGTIKDNPLNSISEKQYIELFRDIKLLMNKLNAEYDSVFYYEDDSKSDSATNTHELMHALLEVDTPKDSAVTSAEVEKLYLSGREEWFKS